MGMKLLFINILLNLSLFIAVRFSGRNR